MSAARLIIAGVLIQAAMLAGAIAGNYAISYHLIQQREAVWCPLLADVQVPPHPTAAQRRGLEHLAAVRRGLGCG